MTGGYVMYPSVVEVNIGENVEQQITVDEFNTIYNQSKPILVNEIIVNGEKMRNFWAACGADNIIIAYLTLLIFISIVEGKVYASASA